VRGKAVRVVTTSLEHPSVHDQARLLVSLGLACTVVRPAADGRVEPGRIGECLDGDTAVVSVMLVNNETGAIQPVREIAEVVRAFSARSGRRILVHTDAAQGFCKVPLLPAELGVDAVSLSGHKIGGPRGIGALWLRGGAALDFLSAGGGQEEGRRPGTENLPGICGMVAAAEKRMAGLARDAEAARAREARILKELAGIPGARVFPEARRAASDLFSPFILSFGFPPLPGEVVVRLAESRGLAIATGAACSSRKKTRTRVLESMGLAPEIARCSVRVSTGPSTTMDEVEALLDFLRAEVVPALALSGGR
jgi:cysteine desulfurase